MTNFLTKIEENELRSLHKQLKDKKNCDRIKSILLLNKGFSYEEISELLLVDSGTIRKWQKKFISRTNLVSWLNDKYQSYSGKLTVLQKKILEDYLTDNIICNSNELIVFIQNSFNITYSHDGVVKLLHRLGFKYKKTSLIPSKFNHEDQVKFKNDYDKLESDLKDNEVILFGDGVHPQHNSVCSKAWIKKGEKREVKSNTGRSRVNIHGAYNPQSQEVIIHEDKTLNKENTINFFKKIENSYQNKSRIYLILDNARYYKNSFVNQYLENSKIEVIFLPPYSPNLNLIERLWKFMRKKIINNKYYEKFSVFKEKILDFFDSIEIYKDEIATFIGCRLQLLKK